MPLWWEHRYQRGLCASHADSSGWYMETHGVDHTLRAWCQSSEFSLLPLPFRLRIFMWNLHPIFLANAACALLGLSAIWFEKSGSRSSELADLLLPRTCAYLIVAFSWEACAVTKLPETLIACKAKENENSNTETVLKGSEILPGKGRFTVQVHLNATMWTYDQSTSSALAKLHKLLHKRRLVIHSTTFQGVQRDFFSSSKTGLDSRTAHSAVVRIVIRQG